MGGRYRIKGNDKSILDIAGQTLDQISHGYRVPWGLPRLKLSYFFLQKSDFFKIRKKLEVNIMLDTFEWTD